MKWAQWDKTQSRELLGLFICVCIALCTIVAHNIAQNRPDNVPSYTLQTITIAPMMSIWGKGDRQKTGSWDGKSPSGVQDRAHMRVWGKAARSQLHSYCYTHKIETTGEHTQRMKYPFSSILHSTRLEKQKKLQNRRKINHWCTTILQSK